MPSHNVPTTSSFSGVDTSDARNSTLIPPELIIYPRPLPIRLLRDMAVVWPISVFYLFALIGAFILVSQEGPRFLDSPMFVYIEPIYAIWALVISHWWAVALLLIGAVALVVGMQRLRKLALADRKRERYARRLRSIARESDQTRSRLRQILQDWDIGLEERAHQIPAGLQLLQAIEIGNAGTIAVSADGKTIACGSPAGEIVLYDVQTGKQLRQLSESTEQLTCLAWSPDKFILASGSMDQTIRLWDASSGLIQSTINLPSRSPHALSWSPDGLLLAVGGNDGTIDIFDSQLSIRLTLIGHTAPVFTLAWSADGRYLASSDADGSVCVWPLTLATESTQVNASDQDTEIEPMLLLGHRGIVRCLNWSPDGKLLASGGDDASVRIWNPQIGQCEQVLEGLGGGVNDLSFSESGALLITQSSIQNDAVTFWDVASWNPLASTLVYPYTVHLAGVLEKRLGGIRAPAYDDIRRFEISQVRALILGRDRGDIISFSFLGAFYGALAGAIGGGNIGAGLGAILGAVVGAGAVVGIILGIFAFIRTRAHARVRARTRALALDFDFNLDLASAVDRALDLDLDFNRVLAYKLARDQDRALDLDHDLALTRAVALDRLVAGTRSLDPELERALAFARQSRLFLRANLLITSGERESELAIWRINPEEILSISSSPIRHYTNAKVVLIGETGAGKTSLGMALMGEPFAPQRSTEGRKVWVLRAETVDIRQSVSEQREVLLWDMAGQQGYRVAHQLHMDDVAVALLVFDNQDETGKSFGEVRYWEQALRQTRKIQGEAARPQKRFLVAARSDRGGIGISRERIDRSLRELDLDQFFVTSAAEDSGITELRQAILDAITWDKMLKVTSSELFQNIKRFLIYEKESGRILTTADELYRALLHSGIVERETREVRQDFTNCIDRVASSGLIQRFDWGGYVLLQPELLDSYVSALVIAARDEPDGLGSILKEDALAGKFHIPMDLRQRVTPETQEQLLVAMVNELIRRDLALLQETATGDYLVFPAQTTRERPEFPNPRGQVARYDFGGAVVNVYATLAVRLARSAIFGKPEIYQNAIQYEAETGGTCGLLLQNSGEGTASLTVFFGEETPDAIRVIFEGFVAKHLEQALNVRRRPIFRCPNPSCGQITVTPEAAQTIRDQGRTSVNCIVCGTVISLMESGERIHISPPVTVAELNVEVDIARDAEAWVTMRRATKNYDVFMSYNVADEKAVEQIARQLIANGIMPWLFKWDEVKGHPFQHEITDAIKHCKLAGAIFQGDSGAGPWQKEEVDVLIAETKSRPFFNVVPVILPETTKTPNFPDFVASRSYVDFRQEEPDPLQDLIRAISGQVFHTLRK